MFFIILASALVFALVGCSGETERKGVKVVFNLEGATYRNMTEPIVYYYEFTPGTENLIKDPYELSGEEYERTNYNFKGWYRTKTVDGDTVTYSDKWDFETDKVTDDGVTLYACWRQYVFDPGRLDDDGNFVSFSSPSYVYDINPSSWKFDIDNFTALNSSIYDEGEDSFYTFTGVIKDIDGNAWDENYEHPRGDEDQAVKVVAEYIKGDYTIVRTAAELKSATSNSANIYLMDDIDFENGTFGGFSAYSGEFDGNGKTVKNFSLSYDRGATVSDDDLDGNGLACLSIFGRASDATVKDVSFENVTVNIDLDYSRILHVYLAPLFVTMNGCTVDNVSFTGTFTCTRLPNGFTADKLHVVSDSLYYLQTGENSMTNIGNIDIADSTAEYFAQE